MNRILLLAIALALGATLDHAVAGGSNYGIAPGKPANFTGKVSEWPVPTPQFARDPAPGPDGDIYITVMLGNKIARFDPETKKFNEWNLPSGAQPHGLLVDLDGMVWYTGNGNGSIGRLDPGTGKVTVYKMPFPGDPHTLVTDGKGTIWFTVQVGDRIGRLDMKTGKITLYDTSGHPYGIALDKAGNVWFCKMASGRLGKLNPATGEITDLQMDVGTMPRRMAAAPDGSLWVTLYARGKLIRVDPVTAKIIKEYNLPGGKDGGPYAVTVDGAGNVWTNEFNTDTVVRLDPHSGEMSVVNLPSKGAGIRKMIVDAKGRLWYMGSHNGRLGVIE